MPGTYILFDKKSNFITQHINLIFDPNKKYEAALLFLKTYNSTPNISKGINSKFKYSSDNGVSWKVLELDTGSNEVETLSDEIQRIMTINGDYDDINTEFNISIVPNKIKLTCIIHISNPNYKVYFFIPKSFAFLLGFKKAIFNAGYKESTSIVDIMTINSILGNISIIARSYVNGSPSPEIYSFYPNVPPGYKIVQIPNPKLIYYPVTRNDINKMEIWLTDQENIPVDLRGEDLTVRIIVKEVKDIHTI